MSTTILCGDCREVMDLVLEPESVNCVITSPPYYGLRDYKLEPLLWGGDSACSHDWATEDIRREMRLGINLAASPASNRGGAKKIAEVGWQEFQRSTCAKCGCWRGCLGQEPTPELYVENLVEVFRDVRRVLRKDGVLWIVIGDSYASQGGHTAQGSNSQRKGRSNVDIQNERPCVVPPGYKDKDLIGIPFMLAFALRADGWYWRMDNVWSKMNCMPSSVEDRTTKAHEYVMHFSQSSDTLLWRHSRTRQWTYNRPPPDYVYRDRAMQCDSVPDSYLGSFFDRGKTVEHQRHAQEGGRGSYPNEQAEEPESWRTELMADGKKRWSRINLWNGFDYYYDADSIMEPCVTNPKENYPARARITGRGTQGAAAARGNDRDKSGGFPPRVLDSHKDLHGPTQGAWRNRRSVWSIATRPFKGAHYGPFPPALVEPCLLAGCPEGGMVLDPFCGTGTVGVVAKQYNRDAFLIDLSPEYCKMAEQRISGILK